MGSIMRVRLTSGISSFPPVADTDLPSRVTCELRIIVSLLGDWHRRAVRRRLLHLDSVFRWIGDLSGGTCSSSLAMVGENLDLLLFFTNDYHSQHIIADLVGQS